MDASVISNAPAKVFGGGETASMFERSGKIKIAVSRENLLKPRLTAEPIRHYRFEQFVESWTVIWMHNVHKLVGDHVVDARDRGTY